MIKGSLSASIQENHQFFSKSKLLASIGLSSFTKQSCSLIYNKNRKFLTEPIFDTLPQKLAAGQTILDIYSPTYQGYTRFSKETQQFESSHTQLVEPSLYSLIEYHENVQFGLTTNRDGTPFVRNPQYDQIILDINNSLERAVIWKINMLEELVVIEITFYDRGKRSNERKIAFKDITIAAPPVSAFGQPYSSNSLSQQRSSIDNFNSLSPIARDGEISKSKFSQDSIAAPVQKFYDSNTNTWKFGNIQILGRLLQDIPQAPIENIDGISYNDPNAYLTAFNGFASGLAIPLSLQAGNPYLFGPSFVGCSLSDDEKKPKELLVTNRSLNSFKAGEVVMLTEINGEWIPQSFGEAKDDFTSPIKFGDWSFFKYIANSDSYFKDARYYDTGEDTYITDIKPSTYEQQSRYKFYSNILTTWINNSSFVQDGIERPSLSTIYGSELINIVALNIGTSTTTFIPSTKFYIGSIFDQLSIDVGGYSNLTILEYVNILDTEAFTDFSDIAGNFYKPRLFKTFWGPAYQDGFKTFLYNPNGKDNNNNLGFFGPIKDPTNPFFMSSFPPKELAADQINQRLFNMPAECGSIFINPFSIFQRWRYLGTDLFLVSDQSLHSPYYGTSEPVSKNKLQFSPLYAEMVATRNPFIILRRQGIQQELGVTELLGNLFKRSQTFGFDDVETNVRMRETEFNEDGKGLKQAPISTAGMPVSSFDPWVGFGNVSSPQGPFCVGVISAKQTISKSGGGDVNFLTNQTFGRHQYTSFTSSQSSVSILGLGVGATAIGNISGSDSARSKPTWGSRVDSHSSFGTTALHVRIFDHWPEDQTVFDPRYFGVLHFNEGNYYDPNNVLFFKTGETQVNLEKRINDAKKLDIPIPTYVDGSIMQLGQGINANTGLLTKDKWKMNPIRRGMLLTSGGFTYTYHVIGLGQPSRITYGGTGFNQPFEFSLPSRNFKINVIVSNGAVVGTSFAKDSLGNDMRGDNFLPSDFNGNEPKIENGNISGTTGNKGFILNIPSQTSGGKSAILYYSSGSLWLKKAKDEGPKGGDIIRLSRSSQAGAANVINGSQETKVTLEKNSSGKYDCFYHFHNDLLHTLYSTYNAMPSWLQYINLTIT